MSPARADRPIFWIVAGPNGSGKSSLYQNAVIEAFNRSIWIINPDLPSARIRTVEKKSLRAAIVEARRRAFARRGGASPLTDDADVPIYGPRIRQSCASRE
jgi:predicted ABC-type ATPase